MINKANPLILIRPLFTLTIIFISFFILPTSDAQDDTFPSIRKFEPIAYPKQSEGELGKRYNTYPHSMNQDDEDVSNGYGSDLEDFFNAFTVHENEKPTDPNDSQIETFLEKKCNVITVRTLLIKSGPIESTDHWSTNVFCDQYHVHASSPKLEGKKLEMKKFAKTLSAIGYQFRADLSSVFEIKEKDIHKWSIEEEIFNLHKETFYVLVRTKNTKGTLQILKELAALMNGFSVRSH